MQRMCIVMMMSLALVAGMMACDKQEDKPNPNQVVMPDGSKYRFNDQKTMKGMGLSKEAMQKKYVKPVTIKQSYFIPMERMGVVMPLKDSDRLLAIDTMFKVHPKPADPDLLTIRDENGTYQLGALMGRVHLDMESGKAFAEIKGKEMETLPEYFRELLLYKVERNFKIGLLYYQGKPVGTIRPKDAPSRIPSLRKVAKPAPPAEKPTEVPESMKKKKDMRLQAPKDGKAAKDIKEAPVPGKVK